MVRYLQHVLRLQRKTCSKGKAKGRRIPKFPHNFPCGCCEPNLPGSQHIAGTPSPCPWKPQRDLSFSQLVYCAHICSWSYMPRQGDNHISVAWVPLWWGIMPSWFLQRSKLPEKPCQLEFDLSFNNDADQDIFCATWLHTEHTQVVRYSLRPNILNQTIPGKQNPDPHSSSFWLLQVFHSEGGRERTLLSYPLHELIQHSDWIGATHKPNCCQKCPSWSLKDAFVFPSNNSLIKYISPHQPSLFYILWQYSYMTIMMLRESSQLPATFLLNFSWITTKENKCI